MSQTTWAKEEWHGKVCINNDFTPSLNNMLRISCKQKTDERQNKTVLYVKAVLFFPHIKIRTLEHETRVEVFHSCKSNDGHKQKHSRWMLFDKNPMW